MHALPSFLPLRAQRTMCVRCGGGFTLVELMVTLAVAAILLAIAVPSFGDYLRAQAARSAANSMVSALYFARSEAIKRNTDVTLTSTAGGWQAGWSVDASTASGSLRLQSQGPLSNVAITSRVSAITYANDGRVQGASNALFQITGGTLTRCVIVALSGLPRSMDGGCP